MRFPDLPWIAASDLRAALAAAGPALAADGALLEEAAAQATDAVRRVISASLSPKWRQFEAWCKAFQRIEAGCTEAMSAIVARLPTPLPETDMAAALSRSIASSDDPVVHALWDAAASLLPTGLPQVIGSGGIRAAEQSAATELAAILLGMDRLRLWAAAAGKQFEVGKQREWGSPVPKPTPVDANTGREPTAPGQEGEPAKPGRRRKRDKFIEVQGLPRELCFTLIRIYLRATGTERPTFSRSSDGTASPSGPLPRYLDHLFCGIRKKLAQEPPYAALTKGRGWPPSAETLAKWISAYRKAPHETLPAPNDGTL